MSPKCRILRCTLMQIKACHASDMGRIYECARRFQKNVTVQSCCIQKAILTVENQHWLLKPQFDFWKASLTVESVIWLLKSIFNYWKSNSTGERPAWLLKLKCDCWNANFEHSRCLEATLTAGRAVWYEQNCPDSSKFELMVERPIVDQGLTIGENPVWLLTSIFEWRHSKLTPGTHMSLSKLGSWTWLSQHKVDCCPNVWCHTHIDCGEKHILTIITPLWLVDIQFHSQNASWTDESHLLEKRCDNWKFNLTIHSLIRWFKGGS